MRKVINIIKGWYYKAFDKHHDLYKQRIEICNRCEKKVTLTKNFTVCSVCGCELSAKTRVLSEKCLMNK